MSNESIFTEALAICDRTKRLAFLDRACAGRPEMRREIDGLLAAHDASNLLDRPLRDIAATGAYLPSDGSVPSASIGDRVGPYKLLEKIGEGGMGDVWVADQLEPIKRRVALKLIKPGMDSRSVLGRFEAERQALAVMDHPNIAKVLDAGTTPDGRPYFVMELVKGTPITEFCDARKLTPKQRLELFIPVCQAIQHAHMKGIIHRDIKPSNVLVALHDETPIPKVIDFGVAKAIGQQLTEKTIYTGFGALIGTPSYMAPEQATFNQLDVDTRADVYALGVLLYELLAGSPPIEADRIKKAALDELLRIVRDEEPMRPSQRLSTSSAKASIAATRQSEPTKLSQMMRGELDWIVMKALEKDRTRRYDTANGLAKDIQRYLNGDAVEACPPTLAYQLKKAYRKNRAAVRVAGFFLCMAAGALTMGAVLGIRAVRAEKAAILERDRALAAEAKTAEEAAVAKSINEFFCDEVFGQIDLMRYGDPNLKVGELLDGLAPRIESRFASRPAVAAKISQAIGDAYYGLEQYEKAIPLVERALTIRTRELGERDADTLLSRSRLSALRFFLLDNGARDDIAAILPLARKELGDRHPVTLEIRYWFALVCCNGLSPLALEHMEAVESGLTESYGPEHPIYIRALYWKLMFLIHVGRYDEAFVNLERAFQVNGRLPATKKTKKDRIDLLFVLGRLEQCRHRFAASISAYSRALEESKGIYDSNHHVPTLAVYDRGITHQMAREYGAAIEDLKDSESRSKVRWGSESHYSHGINMYLARCLLATGDTEGATAKARAALDYYTIHPLPGNNQEENLIYPRAVLGACLTAEKKFEEAEKLLLEAFNTLREEYAAGNFGPHPYYDEIGPWVVELYTAWGKREKAAEWREKVEEFMKPKRMK